MAKALRLFNSQILTPQIVLLIIRKVCEFGDFCVFYFKMILHWSTAIYFVFQENLKRRKIIKNIKIRKKIVYLFLSSNLTNYWLVDKTAEFQLLTQNRTDRFQKYKRRIIFLLFYWYDTFELLTIKPILWIQMRFECLYLMKDWMLTLMANCLNNMRNNLVVVCNFVLAVWVEEFVSKNFLIWLIGLNQWRE